MASESSSPSQYEAKDVAGVFVKRFFTVLHGNPENLHKFYSETATLTDSYVDNKSAVYHVSTGASEIKSYYANQGLRPCRVVVDSVVAHYSAHDSLVVLLEGTLFSNGSEGRRFSRSFLLTHEAQAYNVCTDLLLFMSPPTSSVSKPGGVTGAAVPPACGASAGKVSAGKVCPRAEESVAANETEVAPAGVVTREEIVVHEAPVPARAVDEDVKEMEEEEGEEECGEESDPVVSEAVAPAPQKSYASALSEGLAGGRAAAAVVGGGVGSSNVATERVAPAVAPPTKERSTEAPKNAPGGPRSVRRPVRGDERCSETVFVRGVTPEVNQDDLVRSFERFGKVHSCHMDPNGKFAFVEFEDDTSASQAVAVGSFVIGAVTVKMEPKNPPRRARGRGRGGPRRARPYND